MFILLKEALDLNHTATRQLLQSHFSCKFPLPPIKPGLAGWLEIHWYNTWEVKGPSVFLKTVIILASLGFY